jgi:hypothetical protein
MSEGALFCFLAKQGVSGTPTGRAVVIPEGRKPYPRSLSIETQIFSRPRIALRLARMTKHEASGGRRKRCARAVNGSLPHPRVNANTVNKRAPELFPVMYLVTIWFIRHRREGCRAFGRMEMSWYKSLK